jgi:hypothetical protein
MYSTTCTPARPERSTMLYPEIHLLGEKHGRHAASHAYKHCCRNALRLDPFTDQYFLCVAALCGPNSSRFAKTPLPNVAFKDVFSRLNHMESKYRKHIERFRAEVRGGSLFDANFLRVLATIKAGRDLFEHKEPPSMTQ